MQYFPPCPAPPEAPFIERAEQRRLMLRELAEIGMDLARALKRRVEAEAEGEGNAAVTKRDSADAFQRLSRAIRLTLVLEERTDETLRALIAGEAVAAEARRAEAASRVAKAKAERHTAAGHAARDLVEPVMAVEIGDPEALKDGYHAMEERLREDEAYEDLADKPLREIVEWLCADLGLTPDWSQWTDEGWAFSPAAWRAAPSIFGPSRRGPFRNDWAEPERQGARLG